jgi:hypothetical protein
MKSIIKLSALSRQLLARKWRQPVTRANGTHYPNGEHQPNVCSDSHAGSIQCRSTAAMISMRDGSTAYQLFPLRVYRLTFTGVPHSPVQGT